MARRGQKFRWTTGAPKHGLCHQYRCTSLATENRLCPKHNAIWLSNLREPPMPDYAHPWQPLEVQLQEDVRSAEREIQQLTDLPLRTSKDAEQIREKLRLYEAIIQEARESQHRVTTPMVEAAKRMKKAHEPVITRFTDAANIAKLRLQSFESDA